MYYTGIGSRETPTFALEAFKQIGEELAKLGVILRSGGASGADSAFEEGCDRVNGEKEIFIPWEGFNDRVPNNIDCFCLDSILAKEIAKKFHPSYDYLKPGAKRLMSRNSYQVLGKDLRTPSDFIVCYTDKGLMKGGTSQALRITEVVRIRYLTQGKRQKAL